MKSEDDVRPAIECWFDEHKWSLWGLWEPPESGVCCQYRKCLKCGFHEWNEFILKGPTRT